MFNILIQFKAGVEGKTWTYLKDIWEIKLTKFGVRLDVGHEKEPVLRIFYSVLICRKR